MKVLVIGSGGREHAITYKLKQSNIVDQIYIMPGNPGMVDLGECVPGDIENNREVVAFAEEKAIDLVVVGPEVPLCNGLVDDLAAKGIKAFGPAKRAAALEGSKAFSKKFMIDHGIPTAKYYEVNNYDDALDKLAEFGYPVVIKADGLAAGKGVVIAEDRETAVETLKEMMIEGSLAGAGKKVVLEEFLTGFECSLLCFVDGKTIVPMVSAKDHKQAFDGNKGPNTGGMGTVSPNPFLPQEVESTFYDDVLVPFMAGLKAEAMDYRGVIFIGLMVENGKAKVLEFNVRFGDPETQVILLRLESDLAEIMMACAEGNLAKVAVQWNDQPTACVVLASGGYPGTYQKGYQITGLDKLADDIIVFHAGTAFKDDQIVTNGGRVLNICAQGKSLQESLDKCYNAIKVIDFQDMYYRKDIGLR